MTGVLPVAVRRPATGKGSIALAPSLLPAAVAGGLALLARGLGWRGSDLPAHYFRVAIVKRDGFEIWNNLWYGGHHTLGYGVLFPLLGAAFGIWTVAVLSAAVSAFLADLLLRQATGRRCLLASMWFAVSTVTNVAVGRLPFALGLAVALGALVAAQRRWMLLTALLTVGTAAASPVVSAFLALVFVAWAWSSVGSRPSPVRGPGGPLHGAGARGGRVLPAGRGVPVPRSGAAVDDRRRGLGARVRPGAAAPGSGRRRPLRPGRPDRVLRADAARRQPQPLRDVRGRAGPVGRRAIAPDARPGDPVAAVLAVVTGARRRAAGRGRPVDPRGLLPPPDRLPGVGRSRDGSVGDRADGAALGGRVRGLALPRSPGGGSASSTSASTRCSTTRA